jgi:hypothetical protein
MGCASTGTFSGEADSASPVQFSWVSHDGGNRGEMTAKLADGSTYHGPFVHVSAAKTVDFGPLWIGYRSGWDDWPFWGPAKPVDFSERYSGKVVANLSGPRGDHMRCRFDLTTPQDGLRGGGGGECELPDRRLVRASFASS